MWSSMPRCAVVVGCVSLLTVAACSAETTRSADDSPAASLTQSAAPITTTEDDATTQDDAARQNDAARQDDAARTTSRTEPTATLPTGSPGDQQQAAEQAAMTYLQRLDDLRRGHTDVDAVRGLTTSFGGERSLLEETYADSPYEVVGETTHELLSSEQVDDDEFAVLVCTDVSEVDVLDESGESVVRPDRMPRLEETVTVVWHGDGWLVHETSTLGDHAC